MIRFELTIKNPCYCYCQCQCNRQQQKQAQVIKNQNQLTDSLIRHNPNLAKYLSKYRGQKKSQESNINHYYSDHKPIGYVQEKNLRPIIVREKQKSDSNKKKSPRSPKDIKSPRNKQSDSKGRKSSSQQRKKKSNPHESKQTKSPKSHVPKSPQSKQQKMHEDLKQKAKGSRYLSDTAFRKYFNRQVFQNYGRMNTSGVADGIVYNNYLKTHNINPHTGFNQPDSQQTYKNALVSGSPDKYVSPGQDYYGNDKSKNSFDKSKNSLNLLIRSKSSNQVGNTSTANQVNIQNGQQKNHSPSSKFHENCSRIESRQQAYLKNPVDVSQIKQQAQKHKRMKDKYENLKLSKAKNNQKNSQKQRRKVYSNAGLAISKQQQATKYTNIIPNVNSQKSVKFKTEQIEQNIRSQQPKILQYSNQRSISYVNDSNTHNQQLRKVNQMGRVENREQEQYQRVLRDQSSIPIYNQTQNQNQNQKNYDDMNVKTVKSSYRIETSPNQHIQRRQNEREHQDRKICRQCNNQVQYMQNIKQQDFGNNSHAFNNFYNGNPLNRQHTNEKIQQRRNLSQYQTQNQHGGHESRNFVSRQQKHKNYDEDSHVHYTCCCHLDGIHKCQCCIENIKDKIMQRASMDRQLAERILINARQSRHMRQY